MKNVKISLLAIFCICLSTMAQAQDTSTRPDTSVAVLEVFPTEIETYVTPGDTEFLSFTVMEIGDSVTLTGVMVSATDIIAAVGMINAADISFDTDSFDVEAGGQVMVTSSIPVTLGFEGPGTGQFVVEAENGEIA